MLHAPSHKLHHKELNKAKETYKTNKQTNKQKHNKTKQEQGTVNPNPNNEQFNDLNYKLTNLAGTCSSEEL